MTTILPITLPVTLCLAAVLYLLARRPDETLRDWVLAAALAALAALISEYAIAAAAACAALLLALRRFRSAVAITLGAGLGYLAFRLLADISARPKVDSVARLGQALGRLWTTLSQWLSALGYTLAGAYGRAVSEFRLESSSRGTWIAAFAGAVAAAGAAAWLRAPQAARSVARALEAPRRPRFRRRLRAVRNRALRQQPLERRSLPLALSAAGRPVRRGATLAALDRVVRPRYRAAVFASLAFLASWRITDGAFRVRREQHLMEDVGRQLLPSFRARAASSSAWSPICRCWAGATSRRRSRSAGPTRIPRACWSCPAARRRSSSGSASPASARRASISA